MRPRSAGASALNGRGDRPWLTCRFDATKLQHHIRPLQQELLRTGLADPLLILQVPTTQQHRSRSPSNS